jgi:Domain of unknown function (DUF4173)
MNDSAATTLPLSVPLDRIPHRLAIALALTVFADWLFYDQRLGISVAVFLSVLVVMSLLSNPVHAGRRQSLLAAAILLAGLAPIVEEFNALSATLGIFAVTVAVPSLTNPFIDGLRDRFAALRELLLNGPLRLPFDVVGSAQWSGTVGHLTVWIVPLVLGAIFAALFASANPLIESWFDAIDLKSATSHLSAPRLLFWAATLSVVWPFIAMRWLQRQQSAVPVAAAEPSMDLDLALGELFGTRAILRALVLFNLLFAVETVLDLVYLWGGVALPDGMTYAAYAHRGAYPLIVTALLAAGFVLVAMRPGSDGERRPVLRALVFLWIAQNVMLVMSSILRLDLYVQIYSLTYWRVAAFIWMLLVAVGLVLIVARIALRHSNRWLVLSNLASLALMAYICAFINFPSVIAAYNVDHCREISGNGTLLDSQYLLALGPQALPAFDRYLHDPRAQVYNYGKGPNGEMRSIVDRRRDCLVNAYRNALVSWRAWSFRDWRLQRYLGRSAEIPLCLSLKEDRLDSSGSNG